MRDLLEDYAEKLYPNALDGPEGGNDDDNGNFDIEDEINAEIKDIRRPATASLFTPMRLDVQCGMATRPNGDALLNAD